MYSNVECEHVVFIYVLVLAYTHSLVQESIQCVEEMDSPSKMNVFIRESIFHALEKSSLARTMTGDLLHRLVGSNILSQEQMSGG